MVFEYASKPHSSFLHKIWKEHWPLSKYISNQIFVCSAALYKAPYAKWNAYVRTNDNENTERKQNETERPKKCSSFAHISKGVERKNVIPLLISIFIHFAYNYLLISKFDDVFVAVSMSTVHCPLSNIQNNFEWKKNVRKAYKNVLNSTVNDSFTYSCTKC